MSGVEDVLKEKGAAPAPQSQTQTQPQRQQAQRQRQQPQQSQPTNQTQNSTSTATLADEIEPLLDAEKTDIEFWINVMQLIALVAIWRKL